MNNQFDYRKLVILSASVLVFLGIRWLMKGPSFAELKEQTAGFSYEMPRVASAGNEFDLSGREIDRQIMSEEEKVADPKAAKPADKKKDDKKKDSKKDPKKQAKKDSKDKKKEFETNVVNTRADQGLQSDTLSDSVQQASGFDPNGSKSNVDQVKKTAKDKSANDDDKELTAAQWRDLLSVSPTSENISKFVAAHSAGKISDQDFYGITLGFFNESSAARHDAGLAILGQDKSPSQFLYLAKDYSKVDEQRRSIIWNMMLGFNQPDRLSGINTALTSQDTAIVQLGLQVLKFAIDSKSSNPAAPTPPTTRGGVANSGTQNFVIFIGSLNTISKHVGVNADLAKTLLARIQSLLIK